MKLAQYLTRLVITVFICISVVFATVPSVNAAQSNLKKGLEQLPDIQTKAEDVTKADPYSNKFKVDYKSNQGLNEVQGTADFDRMNRGANGDTLPAVKQVEKAFDRVGSNINSATEDTKNGINSVMDKAGDAANYVKDKAGDTLNSITEKTSDTAKSIKDNTKSLIDKGTTNMRDKADKASNSSIRAKVEDTPESIRFNNVRSFEKRDGDFRDRATDLQTR